MMKKEYYILYILTIVLASCSILYELVTAQTISILTANTVGRYSLTIGIYLGTMGIGAIFCKRIFKRQNWVSLFTVEIILALLGSLSVFTVYFSHMLCAFFNNYENSVLIFFIPSFSAVAMVGFFTGIELPLLIEIGNKMSEKRLTNRVLGMDYLGSLIGALIFPLILLPNLNVFSVSLLTASVNILSAAAILFLYLKEARLFKAKLAATSVMLSAILFSLMNIGNIEQYFLKKYYYYMESSISFDTLIRPLKDFPKVERYSSLYQKIDIVKAPPFRDYYTPLLNRAYTDKYDEDPDFPRYYYLFLNGEYQICTDYEEIYHEYIVHIPIILNKAVPEKVLILGGGDGMLNRELLKYTGIKEIIQVELDKEMIALAKTHPVLSYINNGGLEDSRVEIRIADAYQFMKNNKEKYDAIFIDVPYPVNYNLSKLFSREFYSFIGRGLGENGFAVIDAPGIDLFITDHHGNKKGLDPENDWPIYYSTLKAAGFKTILPYISNLEIDNPRVNEIFLEASRTNPYINMNNLRYEKMYYLWGVQKGFIMLKNNKDKLSFKYKDPDISLHVLNEKRFHLAFDPSGTFPEIMDNRSVNSIMRPTFPSFSFWDIRLPY